MDRNDKSAAPEGEALDRMVNSYLRDEVAHWAPHVREPDFPLARKMVEVFYRYDVGTLASVVAGYHVPHPRPHVKTMHLALIQTLRKVDKVLGETSGEQANRSNPED